MKTLFFLITALSFNNAMAQEKGIPSCFQKKIAESKDYLGLYLAEIEGDILYHLKTAPLPGADIINVARFYDKDCNQANSSASGGITGRPKNYKPYKIIETLWEKEIFPMKSLSQTKQKFEYINSYNVVSPFKFADHQSFYFSFKDGLQLLDKGKVTKTYKIIPQKLVHYSSFDGMTDPTENIPANAWLFEHNEGYWLLVAEGRGYFNLIPTDKEGNKTENKAWISLRVEN
ncbi:hypothetical protein [Elizabethkingia anophelis]|uniref:hypothetical protein n=1 Tax=Elizabethkingia anophelis TaxID=1117645 RepID=UPI00099938F3|nr:hypothetical protein [Elizabethkingia anophelis]OPC39219.1 hypothetical protein BAY02_09925 [Elizabethkingia anophelis]